MVLFCVCKRVVWDSGRVWGRHLKLCWEEKLKRLWESGSIILLLLFNNLTNLLGVPSPTEVQERAEWELSMPPRDYSISGVAEAVHKLLLRKHRITWPFWRLQQLLCHLLFVILFSMVWSLGYNLLLQHVGQCPTCFQDCQSWQERGSLWGNIGAQTSADQSAPRWSLVIAFQGLCFRPSADAVCDFRKWGICMNYSLHFFLSQIYSQGPITLATKWQLWIYRCQTRRGWDISITHFTEKEVGKITWFLMINSPYYTVKQCWKRQLSWCWWWVHHCSGMTIPHPFSPSRNPSALLNTWEVHWAFRAAGHHYFSLVSFM